MNKVFSIMLMVLLLLSTYGAADKQEFRQDIKEHGPVPDNNALVKVCTTQFEPVCGKDGKTYSNSCEATKAGVTYTPGKCPEKTRPGTGGKLSTNRSCPKNINPVCGRNSITYENSCWAERAGVNEYKPGRCSVTDFPVIEHVECLFNGASKSESCYTSSAVEGERRAGCTISDKIPDTNEPAVVAGQTNLILPMDSCKTRIKGAAGEKIKWRSTCGGSATTTMDGTNERIMFLCGVAIPPAEVKEEVKCVFKGATKIESCYTGPPGAWKPTFSCHSGTTDDFGSCKTVIKGNLGEKIEWKSSCSGHTTTVVDGKPDTVVFQCNRAPIMKRIENAAKKAIKEEDFSKELLEDLGKLRRAQVKKVLAADNPHEMIQKVTKLDKPLRTIAKEKKEMARQDLATAKQEYAVVSDEYTSLKSSFQESKKQLNACTSGCEDIEKKTFEQARQFVIRSGKLVVAQISKLIARVEANPKIPEATAAQVLSHLGIYKRGTETAIQNAEKAATKQELIQAAAEIQMLWKKAKLFVEQYNVKLANDEISGIIERTGQLELKLERILETIEAKGIDITALDAKVDEFSTHIEKANELYEQSQAKLEDARLKRNTEDLGAEDRRVIAALVQEAKALTKEAHAHLQKAHAILVSIMKDIAKKDAAGASSILEESTEEADEAE